MNNDWKTQFSEHEPSWILYPSPIIRNFAKVKVHTIYSVIRQMTKHS
jgi:hypothetical protein